MSLTDETRQKLQKQIDALKKRMLYDANDLDYETHLFLVRTLQKMLDRKKCKPLWFLLMQGMRIDISALP